MSRIKTRETVKDIKALDKAAIASERMKDAFIRSKDTASNLMDDGQVSPSEYANDKVQYVSDDISREVTHKIASDTKKAAQHGHEAIQHRRIIKNDEKKSTHQTEELLLSLLQILNTKQAVRILRRATRRISVLKRNALIQSELLIKVVS